LFYYVQILHAMDSGYLTHGFKQGEVTSTITCVFSKVFKLESFMCM